MKKYKSGIVPHMINIISIIVCGSASVLSFVYIKEGVLMSIFALGLLIAIFNCINVSSIFTGIDEKGLVQKSLINEKRLLWDEITQVSKIENPGWALKVAIGISNGVNTIYISSMTSDYKKLYEQIIQECLTYQNINIDPRVFELVDD